MIYLLDVNALLALGIVDHEFHGRTLTWLRARPGAKLATCAITEIGFVRLASRIPAYGFTVNEAQSILQRVKQITFASFTFISDDQDASQLPLWTKTPGQITDGHLVALAFAHGATLATLDQGIPGSHLIQRT